MAAFKILLMLALFTAVPAPGGNSNKNNCAAIEKKWLLDCDQVCNESGKKPDDKDCVLQQCQEACKKAGGNEVIWIHIGLGTTPRDHQCCENTKPEQENKTKPSCDTCKLLNEPEKSWYDQAVDLWNGTGTQA